MRSKKIFDRAYSKKIFEILLSLLEKKMLSLLDFSG